MKSRFRADLLLELMRQGLMIAYRKVMARIKKKQRGRNNGNS